MKGKLVKQLSVLFLLTAIFVIYNLAIYFNFTYRYMDQSSEIMRAQAIELDKYLPFDEHSLIVKVTSEFKLIGELPVLDGATALFPIYSAFVNTTYPKESVDFDGLNFTALSSLQKQEL